MQNWYSQNKPFKSSGVAVGNRVGICCGARVEMDANVVATASCTCRVGVALGPRLQDVKIKSRRKIGRYFICRLYKFSEQIDEHSVYTQRSTNEKDKNEYFVIAGAGVCCLFSASASHRRSINNC